MTDFCCQLNVLRIIISSTDDDQIFQTTGDEEFFSLPEPQIAGTQKRSRAVLREVGLERRFCCFGLTPVPLTDVWTSHPDFTNHTRQAFVQRNGIDDSDLLVQPTAPGTDERGNVIVFTAANNNFLYLQWSALDPGNDVRR